jgi:FTR1 family protein
MRHLYVPAMVKTISFQSLLTFIHALLPSRKSLAKNVFQSSEEIWEGTFALIACIMITVMSLAMLKSQELQEKWRGKLGDAMQNANEKRSLRNLSAKYALLILPMITVLREGLEAMIFVGGVSIPLSVFIEQPGSTRLRGGRGGLFSTF